ncbi:MAG: hypothetical protein U5K33_04105 [Halofilum sp. (in: g-proteobacteria)]|nr:hypothetical protein [Halofilum sp. (in: g-proteobacteria)]
MLYGICEVLFALGRAQHRHGQAALLQFMGDGQAEMARANDDRRVHDRRLMLRVHEFVLARNCGGHHAPPLSIEDEPWRPGLDDAGGERAAIKAKGPTAPWRRQPYCSCANYSCIFLRLTCFSAKLHCAAQGAREPHGQRDQNGRHGEMFYTGDHELRAIEEENLRWRRRILGGFLNRLGRGVVGLLLWPIVAAIRELSRMGRSRRPCCSLEAGS